MCNNPSDCFYPTIASFVICDNLASMVLLSAQEGCWKKSPLPWTVEDLNTYVEMSFRGESYSIWNVWNICALKSELDFCQFTININLNYALLFMSLYIDSLMMISRQKAAVLRDRNFVTARFNNQHPMDNKCGRSSTIEDSRDSRWRHHSVGPKLMESLCLCFSRAAFYR